MAPIAEYMCNACAHIAEEFYSNEDWRAGVPDKINCPHCDTPTAVKLPAAFGGYQGNTGSASTKPKGAGAFKGRKV